MKGCQAPHPDAHQLGGKGQRSYVLTRESSCQLQTSPSTSHAPTQTTLMPSGGVQTDWRVRLLQQWVLPLSSQSSTHSTESCTCWSSGSSSSSSSSSSSILRAPRLPTPPVQARQRSGDHRLPSRRLKPHLRRGLRQDTRPRPWRRCLQFPLGNARLVHPSSCSTTFFFDGTALWLRAAGRADCCS